MHFGEKFYTEKYQIFIREISLKLFQEACIDLNKALIKILKNLWNRSVSCTISQKKIKASLTVEASMVLPVFLFFFMGMIQFMASISIQSAVKNSLYEMGKELAKYAYVTRMGEDVQENLEDWFGAGAYVLAETKFVSIEGKEFWDKSVVKGGSNGFSFRQSTFLDEEGILDLAVKYEVKIPFLMVGEISFPQVQRCYMRGWVGAGSDYFVNQDEMVYVTETGEVYHRNRDCQHLKITIETVTPMKLPGKRNESGGKYYPCEFCGKKTLLNQLYYITTDGDCFHTRQTCSGLKRTVLTIPITEINGRSPCKRCGE